MTFLTKNIPCDAGILRSRKDSDSIVFPLNHRNVQVSFPSLIFPQTTTNMNCIEEFYKEWNVHRSLPVCHGHWYQSTWLSVYIKYFYQVAPIFSSSRNCFIFQIFPLHLIYTFTKMLSIGENYLDLLFWPKLFRARSLKTKVWYLFSIETFQLW